MSNQRIHAAQQQQLLMGDRFYRQVGQCHRLKPAQHAEFRGRIAQAVEHHHPQQRFDSPLLFAGGLHTYAADRRQYDSRYDAVHGAGAA